MFDSRTDSDALRREARTTPDLNRRSYREPGWGDCVEWGTPKARVLACKRVERKQIREGFAEYLAEQPSPSACGVCGAEADPACTFNC